MLTYRRKVETSLPTRWGHFRALGYVADGTRIEHVALVHGDIGSTPQPLVRIHSECLTGDVLGSLRCDCRAQLDLAFQSLITEGFGIIIYLRGQEGRGIGLVNKLRAYELQDRGFDTVTANLQLGMPVDSRDYAAAVDILRDLGVTRLRLMTNNPDKVAALKRRGFGEIERVPLISATAPENRRYLQTKANSMGHLLEPACDSTSVEPRARPKE